MTIKASFEEFCIVFSYLVIGAVILALELWHRH